MLLLLLFCCCCCFTELALDVVVQSCKEKQNKEKLSWSFYKQYITHTYIYIYIYIYVYACIQSHILYVYAKCNNSLTFCASQKKPNKEKTRAVHTLDSKNSLTLSCTHIHTHSLSLSLSYLFFCGLSLGRALTTRQVNERHATQVSLCM